MAPITKHIRIKHSLQATHLCYFNYCNGVHKNQFVPLLEAKQQWVFILGKSSSLCVSVSSAGNVNLSLHKSDKCLNELDEWLLTFVASLGSWCGWFGLGGGEDAAGWRRWWAPAEVAWQAREKSAQLWAELLFEPLFVSREDGGVFETPNSLRDQHVETVLHGEH